MAGLRAAARTGRTTVALALAEMRARPLHMGLGALVAGLLAGPRAPAAVLAGVLVCPLLTRRALSALALVAALLGGAILADARLAALDRTALTERLGHAVSVRVWLLEPARPRPFGGRTAIVRLGDERVLVRTSARVRWPAVPVGRELAVDGVLDALRPADAWLRPRNVHAILSADRVDVTGRARGGLAGTLDGVRERAQQALRRGVPAPESALLRGMVLGQDEALADRTRTDFQATGLTHLVAASGQNVMLLSALVFGVSALLGVGLRARLVLALGLIALYVPLAGGGPSIQRAGVMGAAGIAAALAGRPASRWYALLLAAGATLALNPRAVEDVGWQLSFAAVIAIMVLATPVREGLRRRGLHSAAAEAVALTVAASIGTAPLIALHFDRTSVVSLPANLLAAPAVAPVMWLGMAAATVGQVSSVAAEPFAALAAYPVAFLSWLSAAAAPLPHASLAVAPWLVGVACLGAAAGIVSPAARRPSAAAVLAAGGAAGALGRAPAPPLPPPAGPPRAVLPTRPGGAAPVPEGPAAPLRGPRPPGGGGAR